MKAMLGKKGKVFWKRGMAILLACAMTVTMTKMPVSAAETEILTSASGIGKEAQGNPKAEYQEQKPETDTSVGERVPDTSEGETGPDTSEGETGPDTPEGETGPDTSEGETVPDTPVGETEPDTSEGETVPDTPEEETGPDTSGNLSDEDETGNSGDSGKEETPDASQKPSDDTDTEETEGENPAQPGVESPEEQPMEEMPGSVSANDRNVEVMAEEGQSVGKAVNSGKVNDIIWKIEEGTLTIEGTGDYGDGNIAPPWADREDVTSVIVKVTGITSTEHMFSGCSSLTDVDLAGLDTSRVTDMSGMFSRCKSLRGLDLSGFDTSCVTNMEGMFGGCRSLGELDLSGFDTSLVTNMSGMFCVGGYESGVDDSGTVKPIWRNGCLSDLDISHFNMENVTDTSWMFAGCGRNIKLGHFNSVNVTNMNMMFYSTSILNMDAENFDTSSVTDMGGMFSECQNLTTLDVSCFDTSKVENMSSMFSYCDKLEDLDLSCFDTSRVENMSSMFYYCGRLKDLDLTGFDTRNTENMRKMFSGCNSLKRLDLSSFDMGYCTGDPMDIWELEKMEYICTPVNCLIRERLPDQAGKWYTEDGTEYRELPIGLSESIVLYKNGYPGDGKTKQLVSVTGITVAGKEYDGNPFTYEGTAAVTDAAGTAIPGVVLSGVYSGTLTDGSAYAESANAPVQAGSYTLTFQISGLDEEKYICKKTTYAFRIARKEVTVTAPSVNVALGGSLPVLSTLTCEVSEMAGTDTLAIRPTLKYGTEESKIALDQAGTYAIIPYGAAVADEVAGNYSIRYRNGVLQIGDATEPPAEVVDSGKINEISWSIDKKGKLTVEGTGDYAEEDAVFWDQMTPPWAEDYRILTAEVRVSGITNTTRMFYNCRNLKSIDLSGLKAGKVTDMSCMFEGCYALEELNLDGLNTANVTSMCYMFKNCRSLTVLDLRIFHTDRVQNMVSMFEGCKKLADLDVSSFHTGKTGYMESMFKGCVSLEKLDISNFDTGAMNSGMSANSMGNMFYGCTALKELNMCQIKAYDIHNLFSSCTALQSLKLRGSAENIGGIFKNCVNLKSLDLSEFDTSRITNMSELFSGCRSLTDLNLNDFKTGNVTNMEEMFFGCRSLTNLDVSSFDTGNVGNMGGMFEDCIALSSLDLSNFETGSVTNMQNMFKNCRSLDSLDLSSFTTEKVGGMAGMFQDCSSLTDLDISSFGEYMIKGPYDERRVQDMFSGCSSLTRLDLSHFRTAQSRDMSRMFFGCNSLTDLDVSGFDTGSAKNMSGMFAGCSSLTALQLGGFDTHLVEDMSGMFEGCSNLTDVNVSSFDIGFLKNMSRMFADCEALTSLDLSSFQRPAVVNINRNADMTGMFSGCSSLVDLDMRNFNMDRIYSYVENLFAGCSSLSILYTPVNCVTKVPLPSQTGDQWKSADGRIYMELPQKKAESILIYKNGYLDDGAGGLKKIVTVSGVSVTSKLYDGEASPYSGAAVITDSEGNVIADLAPVYRYSGTRADGTVYTETAEAPTQAGSYRLSVELSGTATQQYALRKNIYSFQIRQREVKISVSSLTLEPGAQPPEDADIKWEAEGFLEGDTWHREPSFRYIPALASPLQPGRYQIIPYGADAGNNYHMSYKSGVLLVGGFGDVLPGDLPSDGVIPEGLWIAGLSDTGYAYTGKAIRPEVRVYDYKTLLREKVDYTVAYKNNTKADKASVAKTAPTVTVTGKGNYTGKETQTFRILPLDIGGTEADGNFAADDMAVAYSNKPQKPAPVLIWNDTKLKNRTDYTYTYVSGTDGGKLDSVKEPGVYWIEIAGKGNFKGSRRLRLLVTDTLKPVSKLSVGGVKAQPYTGDALMPQITVKDGKTTLTENTHYTVAYSRNTAVGTAYAVVTGIETAGYCGAKRISFKITGTPIKKAVVTGLAEKEFSYGGVAITPKVSLSLKVKKDGVTVDTLLREGTDYTVDWQKNREAGTASAIFTGKGAYTGTMKKSFKILPFDLTADKESRVTVALLQESVPYAKGGAKPAVSLTFRRDDGSTQVLTEGKDYTLTFKNHKALNDGSDTEKLPAVTIKGKGCFKGTYGKALTYTITKQELGKLKLSAQDKTYQNKKNGYVTKVTVTDLDGTVLRAGTDYDKNVMYTYQDETTVQNISGGGSAVRAAGTVVNTEDIIPAGTVLRVTVKGKDGGNYTGTLSGEYRISKSSISSAAVSVPKQVYTGQEITLDKEDITVKVKGRPIDENQERSQWEIVPGSYKNNVKKGTASVTIKGADNYGGEKTVKFTIKPKGFLWWWR